MKFLITLIALISCAVSEIRVKDGEKVWDLTHPRKLTDSWKHTYDCGRGGLKTSNVIKANAAITHLEPTPIGPAWVGTEIQTPKGFKKQIIFNYLVGEIPRTRLIDLKAVFMLNNTFGFWEGSYRCKKLPIRGE